MNTDNIFAKLEGCDQPADLVELLQLRAQFYNANNVYHFIEGENKPVSHLTYRDLEQSARALGAALQGMNAQGQRIVLLCPPGLHYMIGFWGCLFAGAIAVPAYPPVAGRLNKTLPRIEAILEDCQPSIALALTELTDIADELAETSALFRNLTWVDLNKLELTQASAWVRPQINPTDIAFLQYTSGSTSTPKGVMVTHANLIHNSRAIFRTNNGCNQLVSWLPPYHDMGLIGTIIQVVYGGGWGYFMAPTTFLRYPALWLQTISDTGATVSVAPNFGYEHCVNKITDAQLKKLDLHRWQHAYSGAEPVRAATLDAFSQRFSAAGFSYNAFQPSYGLAEVTLQVTGGKPANGARRLLLDQRDLEMRKATEATASKGAVGIESVACGHPVDDTAVAIVNPDTCQRTGVKGIGEVWVNSPSVAAGYWKRPKATKVTFQARILGEGDKPYLRTGDLGFIDEQGELHITGRIKDLILLHGRNLYPNDIESIAQSAYTNRRGKVVALGVTLEGKEELVVIMEGFDTNTANAVSLVTRARQILGDAPLEVAPYAILVVRSGAIPQTSSGKLQRHAAQSQFLKLELNPIFASILAEDNPIPSSSTGTSDQPGLDNEVRIIDEILSALPSNRWQLTSSSDRLLPELGIDYPALISLVRRLQTKLGKRISLSSIVMQPSLRKLIQLVQEQSDYANQHTTDSPAATPSLPGEVAVQQWLINRLSTQLDLPKSEIDLDMAFVSLGLDSRGSVELAQALSEYVGVNVPETLVWEAPTLRSAIQYLTATELGKGKESSTREGRVADEPIAIIGMGCRFPGAADVESFWRLLLDERDAVTLVPPDRWPNHRIRETKTGRPVSEWGGFLDQIDGFEPAFFGLSNREAQRMDPQQRLLLEVSWEALEHAGINPRSLAGSDTGVFVAVGHQEYWSLQLDNVQDLDIHSCTGSSQAVAANRISYLLDLRGPSMAVDTACSGSLVSVHLACESLRRSESTLAVAGGVNLMIKPDLTVAFSEAQMLSGKGRCSTFDEAADGYVRGEGCGLVVLQRLSDAIREKRPIIAVINGSAVLHDGRSNGLTAPNPQAQDAVVRRALSVSRLDAADVDYVEAHGTGTPLGDPIETKVLAAIYGKQRAPDRPCVIGSVKTNIGHLESAAGIAGLIKAALCVERKFIPAHLHFSTPNSKMDWQNSGLKVANISQPWLTRKKTEPVHAAVSSFGFGGTVAHTIISSADTGLIPALEDAPAADWQLLVMSAREAASLSQQMANLYQHILAQPDAGLADICYTAATGRAAFANRLAIVGSSTEEILQQLRSKQESVKDWASADSSLGKIAFCFSGQGSQYLNMAADLIANEPVFYQVIARCSLLIEPSLGHSLFDLLSTNKRADLLQDTRLLQPTLYVLQVALAELWRSWGVVPDVVLGHSLGEFAAMHVAGIVSLEDGLRLVDARARAMASQPQDGGMVACLGDLSSLDKILVEYTGRVWTAAYNAPNNRVIAGYKDALNELSTRKMPGITVKPLRVSNAMHSPIIAGAAQELQTFAETICFKPAKIACITNLGGKLLNTAPSAEHFAQHLCRTVDFQASIDTALALGCRTFIEIGPGRSLLNFARLQAESQEKTIHCLPSLLEAKPNCKVILESLAQLWMAGGKIDWKQFYKSKQGKSVHMPGYSFFRTKHWHETASPTFTITSLESNFMKGPNTHQSNNVFAASTINSALDLFRSQTAVLQKLSGLDGQQESAAAQILEAAPVQQMTIRLPDTSAQIIAKIQQHLGRIVGCPATNIGLRDRLNSNLGLDSLMRTELDRLMLAQWPELAQVDRTTLGDDPLVEDLVSIVTNTLGVTKTTRPAVVADEPQEQAAIHQTRIVPENDFEKSEAYLKMMARMDLINAVGSNPYGRIHQGFNGARATLNGVDMLNFASFNYSSLSNHPEVCEAAKEAINTYGTSPSATPLLFGETPLHHELEAEIASYLGTEAAVVFASGHSTSVAVIGHIMEPEDLIIHDQYIHDCAIRGAILSGAKRRSFAHDDWQELDQILTQVRNNYRRVLIIIEGVYSQDGDIANLPEFIKIKKKHQCMLMIDEAHSIGVLGKTGAGIGEYYNVDRKDVDIWMGTLSKGLGSCGGYIAASKNFIRFLKYTTPLLIFSTGITPANAAAALQSIRVLRKDPARVQSLQQKYKWFLARAKELGFDTGPSFDSPIIPIIVGSWEKAMVLSNMLIADAINVMPIGYPAVEKDKCRLRFFVNIEHKEEELEYALQCLKTAMLNFKEEEPVATENSETV